MYPDKKIDIDKMYYAILNDDGTHEVIGEVGCTKIEIDTNPGIRYKVEKDDREDK